VPLNLYRRHFRAAGKCAAGYSPDCCNYESDELRRGWKKCHCPIYADGTLGGRFKRKNTKAPTWDAARSVAAQWETLGKWDDAPLVQTPVVVPEPRPSSPAITIHSATEAYLANRMGRNITESTLRKYKTFTKQLHAFADSMGYVMLDQFRFEDMDRFYISWRDGIARRQRSWHG
jgi:hypothetical protein